MPDPKAVAKEADKAAAEKKKKNVQLVSPQVRLPEPLRQPLVQRAQETGVSTSRLAARLLADKLLEEKRISKEAYDAAIQQLERPARVSKAAEQIQELQKKLAELEKQNEELRQRLASKK